METEITRIGIISVAKMSFVLGIAIGIIIVVPALWIVFEGPNVVVVIAVSTLWTTFAAVVLASAYNLLAGTIGGIEVDLSK